MGVLALTLMMLLSQWLRKHLKVSPPILSQRYHSTTCRQHIPTWTECKIHLKIYCYFPSFFWFPNNQKKIETQQFLLAFLMEPWQSCCAIVCYRGTEGERRIKQTTRVNLQQQTNQLCAQTWCKASFVRGVSIKGFEHSHPLPGVTLRGLVSAALTPNGNKYAFVKEVV